MGRNHVSVGVGVGVAVALLVSGAFGAGRAADAGGRGKADPVVELGRRLFFDPAVSRSSDNACASCHDPAHGFSSPSRLDVDDFSMTKRHSQSLVDTALGKRFHWDGEFDSVADLVTARLSSSSGQRPERARALVAAVAAQQAAAAGADTPPPPPGTPPPPSPMPPSARAPPSTAAEPTSASRVRSSRPAPNRTSIAAGARRWSA